MIYFSKFDCGKTHTHIKYALYLCVFSEYVGLEILSWRLIRPPFVDLLRYTVWRKLLAVPNIGVVLRVLNRRGHRLAQFGIWVSTEVVTSGSCRLWQLPLIPKYYFAVFRFSAIDPTANTAKVIPAKIPALQYFWQLKTEAVGQAWSVNNGETGVKRKSCHSKI